MLLCFIDSFTSILVVTFDVKHLSNNNARLLSTTLRLAFNGLRKLLYLILPSRHWKMHLLLAYRFRMLSIQ